MSIIRACPHCQVKVRIPEELDGKKVRCQKCTNVFIASAGPAEPEKLAVKPAPAKSARPADETAVRASDRPRSKPKPEEELVANLVEDDDEDDRPRKKKRSLLDEEDDEDDRRDIRRKKKKKPVGSNFGLVVGLVIGGVVLLFGVIGTVVAMVLFSGGNDPVALNAPPPRWVDNPAPNGNPNIAPPGGNVMRRKFNIDDDDFDVGIFRGVRKPNLAGPKQQFLKNAKQITLVNGAGSVTDRLSIFDSAPRKNGKRSKAYRVNFEAGTVYTIEMMSRTFDSYIYLLNPDGIEIAEDDDSGNDLDSFLSIQIDRGGTYEIHASSFAPGEAGNFTLSIRKGQ